MTFKVSITRRGESMPFWSKVVPTREDADRVARKNQRLIDRQQWEHTIAIEEVP